jgi:hypothetical protein
LLDCLSKLIYIYTPTRLASHSNKCNDCHCMFANA